jgi:uncharacterized membrane protein (DUF485 family)
VRTRDEYRTVVIQRDSLMRLLVIFALVLVFASLMLIGLLALFRELLSDSIFGAPAVSDQEARRGDTDKPQSTSSSVTALR